LNGFSTNILDKMSIADDTTECQTCCEKYTKQQRKYTCCQSCSYECCSQCIKTYIMGQSAEPHCMNCSKPYSRDFLHQMLGITFIKTTYKEKKKTLLYEVEKSKMPATMGAAKRYNECAVLRKDVDCLRDEREILRAQMDEITTKMTATQTKIWSLETGISDTEKKKKREYTHPCVDERCNGFMSSQWKCGICKKFGCHLCHEVIGMRKDDPHECDEDTVKTVATIKSDTHPCPKCHAPIFKISGCDQMWCTQCEVAFSWKTGEIQRGNVHNPHFYEAKRRLGINTRNPGDVVCGGLVDAWQFRRYLGKHCKETNIRNYVNIEPNMSSASKLFQLIYVIVHRSVTHNIHVLDTLRTDVRYLQSNERMRVRFLVGETDEDTFKKEVYQRNEKMNKKRRLCDIFETYINVMVENVNAMGVDLDTSETKEEAFKKVMKLYIECEKIRIYTECEFLKIGIEYRQATYNFNNVDQIEYKRIDFQRHTPSGTQSCIKPSGNWDNLSNHIKKMEKETYTESSLHKLFTKSSIGLIIGEANTDFLNCLHDTGGGAAAGEK